MYECRGEKRIDDDDEERKVMNAKMNEEPFGCSWCCGDEEGSRVEDAVRVGAARTKDSRFEITVLIVETRKAQKRQ